jgi:hypothetical protein
MIDYRSIPILINSRDVRTPLERLVTWLLEAGYTNLFILDNDSSYPPLLEYYSTIGKDVTVVPLGVNAGFRALWDRNVLEQLDISTHFVYTDSDIIPIEECPKDCLRYFLETLNAYPRKTKVGFGLKIDDLPDHYQLKRKVVDWESQFWERRIRENLYDAMIDTTFAVYRPRSPYDLSGIRTGFPYLARHYPWYEDTANPTAERSYYVQHAMPAHTNWGVAQLSTDLDRMITERSRLSRKLINSLKKTRWKLLHAWEYGRWPG